MGIKKKIRDGNEKIKAKRIQKQLIKKDDDFVVETLTESPIDNTQIDIKTVVKNMENPEKKVEVVQNNLEVIIEQDNVRDTLEHLPDKYITQIVEEHEDQLKENEKLANAILPIKDNQRKLNYAKKNLSALTDLELQNILGSLLPENSIEAQRDVEREKIKLIGSKFLENIEKYGSVFRLGDFTENLTDESKMDLFYSFMGVMANHESSRKIDFKAAKLRFAEDFSYIAKVDWNQCIETDLLTREEVKCINSEKRKKQLQKDARSKSNSRGR